MAKRTGGRPHGRITAGRAHLPKSHRPRHRRFIGRQSHTHGGHEATKSRGHGAGHAPPARAVTPRLWPASAAAVLLGAAAGMIVTALCHVLAPRSVVGGMPARTLVGAALLALALGVRVPQRFAVWVCTMAWRRALGAAAPPAVAQAAVAEFAPVGAAITPHAAERPLYWLVLAVLALSAGILTATTPLTIRAVASVRQAISEGFLWSAIPLEILDALTAQTIVLFPLALLGVGISCVHHLCCLRAEWDERATVWCTIGAAAGFIAADTLSRILSPSAAVIASALPSFALSMLAALLGSSDEPAARAVEGERPTAPVCRDRWPMLLRAAIAAAAGGGACLAMVWTDQLGQGRSAWTVALTGMLVALAGGIYVEHRTNFAGSATVGGFGAACAISGLAVALGARISHDGVAASPVSALALASFGAGAIGVTISYGQQALLARAASRSSAGARQLGGMLGCAALTVLLTAPLAVYVIGHRAALLMLALSLVALGGTLVIHETQDLPRRRRAGLGVVFGSLAAVLVFCVRPGGSQQRPAEASAAAAAIGR